MYGDSAIYIISADMHCQLTTTSAKCINILSLRLLLCHIEHLLQNAEKNKI